MKKRYMVTRQWIKYKGSIYLKGALLPEEFSAHDALRLAYPRRVSEVECDEAVLEEATKEIAAETPSLDKSPQGLSSSKGIKRAENAAPLTKPTGALPKTN